MLLIILFSVLTLYYCISLLYLFSGLLRLPKSSNTTENFLSVVIAAHNEEKSIQRCLDSLDAQDYPRDKYEIIIANDRSTDDTECIVSEFCNNRSNANIVSVHSNESFIPKKTALAKAFAKAKGDVIVSTDADCMLPKTWLSSMNKSMSDNIGMAVGHTSYGVPTNIWQGIDGLDYFSHRAMGIAFIGADSAYTCTASNYAIRTEIYKQNQEEFSQLKVRPAEDNYFLHCVHKHPSYSFSVPTETGSIVTTKGAQSFIEFWQQRFRWGAYGGNITTIGMKLFFIPMLLYYASLWLILVLACIFPVLWLLLGISLACKCVCDLLFMAKAAALYHSTFLMKYFIPLFLLHFIMVPLIVIKGNLFSFTWKDIQYTKDKAL